MTTIEDCRLLDLPTIERAEGNITPIEGNKHIPFEIARVYYLYDVPGGASRGGHAHKRLCQLMVSVMGSFDVILDDGFARKRVHLNRAYHGLYLPNMIWRELANFSSGAICIVLASELYEESEYIREYSDFVQHKKLGAQLTRQSLGAFYHDPCI
jgi:WxcM-like, C-terminal